MDEERVFEGYQVEGECLEEEDVGGKDVRLYWDAERVGVERE